MTTKLKRYDITAPWQEDRADLLLDERDDGDWTPADDAERIIEGLRTENERATEYYRRADTQYQQLAAEFDRLRAENRKLRAQCLERCADAFQGRLAPTGLARARFLRRAGLLRHWADAIRAGRV